MSTTAVAAVLDTHSAPRDARPASPLTSPVARPTCPVFYLGPEDTVAQALALSDELKRTADVAQAAVIVINGVRPTPEVATQIRERVEAGQAGLLLMGPELDATALLGCRLSPLHNRFRTDLPTLAAAEAESLTKERVSLREIRPSETLMI